MTARSLLLLPLLALGALSLAACGHKESMPESASTTTPPVAAPTAKDPMPAGAAQTGAAPIGPISSRGETVPASPGGGAPAAQSAGLDFDLPANWQSQPPDSQMRLAQAAIPGPGGPGQLAVFFFGPGGGGGVDANIKRWIDQMEPAKGSNPKPETFQTDKGFKVTWVDVAGALKPSSMGMGPAKEQPGSRLLGAVVEGPGGPWFFKATGPDSTLAGQRDAFLTMLKSVRSK
jgi:hypothetical protein